MTNTEYAAMIEAARAEGVARAIEHAEYMAKALGEAGEVVRAAEWQDLVQELREGDSGRALTRLIAEKQGEAQLAERQRIASCDRVRARYAHEGQEHAKVALYFTDDRGRVESLILAPREFDVDDRARIAEKQAEALEAFAKKVAGMRDRAEHDEVFTEDECRAVVVELESVECVATERAAAYRKGGAP